MRLCIGTYSLPIAGMAAHGEGLYGVDLDPATGRLSTPTLLARCVNPSSLTVGPRTDRLYAVRETFAADGPAVAVHAIDGPIGRPIRLTSRVERPVAGDLPCHLAVDPTGRWLATAQYGSGDVSLFAIDERGDIGPAIATLGLSGSGPRADRQGTAHAHHVAFADEHRLYVTDLGSDRVWTLEVKARTETPLAVSDEPAARLPAGCGPRHLALARDGRTAWVANELDETVSTLVRERGRWSVAGTVPAFDARADGGGSLAAIRLSPDERHLYVSGRRRSTIAWFAIEPATGALRSGGRVAAGGRTPRDFLVSGDGRWVVAANQDDGRISVLRRDAADGALKATGEQAAVPSPVALIELPPA